MYELFEVYAFKIFGAIVSGASVALVRAYFLVYNSRRNERLLNTFSDISRCMRRVTAQTKVDRFLLFKMTNNAHEIFEGKVHRYRVSCLLEEHSDNMIEEGYKYQKLLVDDNYVSMVRNALVSPVDIVVETMENSMLKKVYSEQGVRYSRVYTIYIDKKGHVVYFLSVASYRNNFQKDFRSLKILQEQVTRIKELYEALHTS